MNISFIISCPIHNGKGHLTRVSSLANQLNNKSNLLSLYIISKNLRLKEIASIKYFNKKKILQKYSELFSNNFNFNTVILDDYNITLRDIKKLNHLCKKILYFQDHNIINLRSVIPIKSKMIMRNNHYYFKNIFLNPKFFFHKKIKKNNKILISFGSGRISTKLLIFLRFLKKIDKELLHTYNLDITNDLNINHQKIINSLNKIKINKINNSLFFKNINSYNFSINASGVTSLELLYLQIPQILFKISKNQMVNYKNLKKIKSDTIITIDSLSTKNFKKFKYSFYFMIKKNFFNFKKNKSTLKIVFDSNKLLIDYISNYGNKTI